MAKSLTKPPQTTEARSAAVPAGSEAVDDYLKAIFQLSGSPSTSPSQQPP